MTTGRKCCATPRCSTRISATIWKRERVHRKPARPYRRPAEDAGQGNARAHQGGRFQRAGAGAVLTPICASSAKAVSTKCTAARHAMAARSRSCSTATNSRPSTTISSSAARDIHRITSCRPGAPTSRARNISPSGCATGHADPTATIWSRKPTARWCGARTPLPSTMRSSTTIIGRCKSGVIASARSKPTTC